MKKTISLLLACVLALSCAGMLFASAEEDLPEGALEFQFSHVNCYSWGTFYDMVTYGEGRNCHNLNGPSDYPCDWWIAIKVDNVEGVYTVTQIEGNGEAKTMGASADGFIMYLYCSNDTCPSNFANAQLVQVGDVVYSHTFDWTTDVASGADEPLGNIVLVPAGTDLPAEDEPEAPADTSVTANVLDGTLSYTEADLAKLIDGNDAAGATSFGDAGFVSFENKGFAHTDGVDAAVEATVELVLDLGAVKTLSNVTLSAFKDSNSMIALPTVKFYLSNDGENFYEINAGAAVAPKDDLAETATAAISPSFSNRIAVNARYVKAVCTFKNGWLFLSELGVTLSDAEGEDLDGKYAYTDSYMEGYCIGVYHPEDGELDLSLNEGGKMLKSSQLIKAAYDAEAGAYKVIYSKVNAWPDGHTGTETLAEGEILVAISTQGNLGTDAFSGIKWIARGLVEGDYVVLDDENKLLSFYPASAFAAEEPGQPDQPDTPVTGDTGILVFAVLAVVAVLGCAVASKIKSSAL